MSARRVRRAFLLRSSDGAPTRSRTRPGLHRPGRSWRRVPPRPAPGWSTARSQAGVPEGEAVPEVDPGRLYVAGHSFLGRDVRGVFSPSIRRMPGGASRTPWSSTSGPAFDAARLDSLRRLGLAALVTRYSPCGLGVDAGLLRSTSSRPATTRSCWPGRPRRLRRPPRRDGQACHPRPRRRRRRRRPLRVDDPRRHPPAASPAQRADAEVRREEVDRGLSRRTAIAGGPARCRAGAAASPPRGRGGRGGRGSTSLGVVERLVREVEDLGGVARGRAATVAESRRIASGDPLAEEPDSSGSRTRTTMPRRRKADEEVPEGAGRSGPSCPEGIGLEPALPGEPTRPASRGTLRLRGRARPGRRPVFGGRLEDPVDPRPPEARRAATRPRKQGAILDVIEPRVVGAEPVPDPSGRLARRPGRPRRRPPRLRARGRPASRRPAGRRPPPAAARLIPDDDDPPAGGRPGRAAGRSGRGRGGSRRARRGSLSRAGSSAIPGGQEGRVEPPIASTIEAEDDLPGGRRAGVAAPVPVARAIRPPALWRAPDVHLLVDGGTTPVGCPPPTAARPGGPRGRPATTARARAVPRRRPRSSMDGGPPRSRSEALVEEQGPLAAGTITSPEPDHDPAHPEGRGRRDPRSVAGKTSSMARTPSGSGEDFGRAWYRRPRPSQGQIRVPPGPFPFSWRWPSSGPLPLVG